MAPKKLHMFISATQQESLTSLRHFELEAYSSVVTALRAEGNLNENKRIVLKQLQEVLSISNERHKAEIRRAANDEKLASIAECVQGYPCNDDWQSEGRRIFGILNHPLPITAYTRLADEVAESLVYENNHCIKESFANENHRKEIVLAPPTNPQQSVNKKFLEDMQSCKGNEFSAISTQSEDLNEFPQPYDSLVFLPSGGYVKVDTKGSKLSHTVILNQQSKDLSSLNQSSTKLYCELPEIDDIKKTCIANASNNFSTSQLENDQEIELTVKTQALLHNKNDKSDLNVNPPYDRQHFVERTNVVHCKQTLEINNQTSLQPNHSQSWALKQNLAGVKNKRKSQRPSVSGSKKLSRSFQSTVWRSSSPTSKKARLSASQSTAFFENSDTSQYSKIISAPNNSTVNIKNSSNFRQNASLKMQSYDEVSFPSTFDSSHQLETSPQKIFSISQQIKNPTTNKTESLPHKIYSPLQGSDETGLAPVSTIVSQVGTHSGIPFSANLSSQSDQSIPIHSESQKLNLLSTFKAEIPKNTLSLQLNDSKFPKFISSGSEFTTFSSCSNIDSTSFTKPLIINSIKTDQNKDQPISSISHIQISKETDSLVMTTETDTTSKHNSQLQINVSSTAASFTMPRLVTASLPGVTPISSNIATANIIKVSPKTLAVTKGSQIVTQIAGTRVTKPISAIPGVKPSIIVVRQAGKKTISSTSTKLLEIEGSGKTLSRVTVTSATRPVVNIIRPVSSKVPMLGDITSVTASSYENPASSSLLHKVVTKGKLRQLVIKPAASPILPRPSNHESSSLLFPMASSSESTIGPDILSSRNDSIDRSPPPLQAASTIKALAAIQKATSISNPVTTFPMLSTKLKPALSVLHTKTSTTK